MADVKIEFRVIGKKFRICIGKNIFTYPVTGLLVQDNEVVGYEAKLTEKDLAKWKQKIRRNK